MSVGGKNQVAKYRHQLEGILRKVMLEHSQEEGCGWKVNAMDVVIDAIMASLASQEICKDKAAA